MADEPQRRDLSAALQASFQEAAGDLVALRAEVEIGFRVRDVDAFGVLTDGTFSGS